jgi:hypothetical protein
MRLGLSQSYDLKERRTAAGLAPFAKKLWPADAVAGLSRE